MGRIETLMYQWETNFTLFKVGLKVTSFLNKPAVLITNIDILQWCCNDFNGFSEF